MAYKGTDKNLQCRSFQYEIGKQYDTDKPVELCEHGFHACENPLDVWGFYPPTNGNRFFEVEQSGNTKTDEVKTVSSNIKINCELSFSGLIKAAVNMIFTKAKVTKDAAATTGYRANAATTGEQSAACALGISSRVMACKGWIVLVDWRYDKTEWKIKEIYHAKVGQKIKNKTIKPDVWYWFEGGKLKSEANNK